jgi:hypothetical protein
MPDGNDLEWPAFTVFFEDVHRASDDEPIRRRAEALCAIAWSAIKAESEAPVRLQRHAAGDFILRRPASSDVTARTGGAQGIEIEPIVDAERQIKMIDAATFAETMLGAGGELELDMG